MDGVDLVRVKGGDGCKFWNGMLSYRAGLIHVCVGTRGAPLPNELKSIKFGFVFCELVEDQSIHSIMSKQFNSSEVVF